jgi:hypothetical protein
MPPFAPRGPSGRFPRFNARTAALRLPVAPPRSLALAQRFRLATERQDLPSSSATRATHAPGFDPGRAVRQASGALPLRFASTVLPSVLPNTSASATSLFRDSIPQPACSLSTLRGHGCPSTSSRPRKTRFQLEALPWLGGIRTRWVANQVSSRVWLHMFPPGRSLLGARGGGGVGATLPSRRFGRVARGPSANRSFR